MMNSLDSILFFTDFQKCKQKVETKSSVPLLKALKIYFSILGGLTNLDCTSLFYWSLLISIFILVVLWRGCNKDFHSKSSTKISSFWSNFCSTWSWSGVCACAKSISRNFSRLSISFACDKVVATFISSVSLFLSK